MTSPTDRAAALAAVARLADGVDNVAIALSTLPAGRQIEHGGTWRNPRFTLPHPVLEGHRFAITPNPAGGGAPLLGLSLRPGAARHRSRRLDPQRRHDRGAGAARPAAGAAGRRQLRGPAARAVGAAGRGLTGRAAARGAGGPAVLRLRPRRARVRHPQLRDRAGGQLARGRRRDRAGRTAGRSRALARRHGRRGADRAHGGRRPGAAQQPRAAGAHAGRLPGPPQRGRRRGAGSSGGRRALGGRDRLRRSQGAQAPPRADRHRHRG